MYVAIKNPTVTTLVSISGRSVMAFFIFGFPDKGISVAHQKDNFQHRNPFWIGRLEIAEVSLLHVTQ